jgi:hypothetical protein
MPKLSLSCVALAVAAFASLSAPAAALAGDGAAYVSKMQQGHGATVSTSGDWDHSYEFRAGKWGRADHRFDLPSAPKTNPGPPDTHARHFSGVVSRFSAGVRSSPPLPKATPKTR